MSSLTVSTFALNGSPSDPISCHYLLRCDERGDSEILADLARQKLQERRQQTQQFRQRLQRDDCFRRVQDAIVELFQFGLLIGWEADQSKTAIIWDLSQNRQRGFEQLTLNYVGAPPGLRLILCCQVDGRIITLSRTAIITHREWCKSMSRLAACTPNSVSRLAGIHFQKLKL